MADCNFGTAAQGRNQTPPISQEAAEEAEKIHETNLTTCPLLLPSVKIQRSEIVANMRDRTDY